ncbi:uncharacterized protein N0V89_011712 [Didymosphaeria variabile]|uniref:Glutaredoxin domain-containing protein n=1 Tax=Didymosphaeria variabile TaxID=1932322 RepID=A0A9W8XAP7_9PLEO|nr:uncharacterized protein N0V89_011712 [Didymosphaeria variabile]KAJ4345579.1 hypothetical protein N0V89_011712 [Didymosphaeria variabile]
MAELAAYDNDPTLYLFTSLTAGSSHIITATSRIETILKANKVPFKGVDTATDELARKLYQRRARGKKLPLLVKEGFVIADLDQVEEWNEYDELKEALGAPAVPAPAVATPLAASKTPATGAAAAASGAVGAGKENVPSQTPAQNLAIRQAAAEAAKVAASKKPTPAHISTTNPLLASKASPSVSTPSKPTASPRGILSPRSIPLPSTPANVAGEGLKSPGVKSPLSPTSEFHGRKVESPGEEEIKLVEKQTAIEEATSSEEEDSEDDDDDDDDDEEEEEDEEDEEDDEDEDEEEESAAKLEPVKEAEKGSAKMKEAKTQAQDAKAADKAGVSVED